MARGPMQPVQIQPVRVAPSTPPISPTAMTVIIVSVIAALYFGRDIFVPLALSILLSFALAPIATRLRRWGLGRVPSVILVVLLVFTLVLGFGAIVASQIVDLADNLPRYEYNLRAKIRALGEAAPSGGLVEQTTDMVRDVGEELEKVTQSPAEGLEGRAGESGELDVVKPIPVEIHEPPAPPLAVLRQVAGPLVGPLATGGVVLVFVIFVLLQREDLRDRLIRLFGSGDVHRTTEAMNDAAKRVSRYLLMQLVINVLYGIPVGVGLYFIGVPNPLLWGLLATVLRFIPYVGPVIAALAPIALSFAVAPDWTAPLLTVTLFVTLELFSNNVLEPWLYGASTGLSPVAIIVAAVFWTVLWGPVGLLLSTPLTVCLVVLGRHIPQLQFLEVLLGTKPVLAAKVKFYQRMLAGDPHEATELAEEFLEEGSLDRLYDEVIVPALAFAEQDRLRGVLDRDRRNAMARDTMEVIDQLMAEDDLAADERTTAETRPPRPTTVLCAGARNSLDEAAAAALAHLLKRRGLAAKVLSSEAVGHSKLARLERDGVALVCLSYVNPEALQHARRLIRRLRQHFRNGVPIMLGLWNAESSRGELKDAPAAAGADLLAASLPEAVKQVQEALRTSDAMAVPSPTPAQVTSQAAAR